MPVLKEFRERAKQSVGTDDEATVFEIRHLVALIALIDAQLKGYKKK